MYGSAATVTANKIVETIAIPNFSLYFFAKLISLEKIFMSNAFPDFVLTINMYMLRLLKINLSQVPKLQHCFYFYFL